MLSELTISIGILLGIIYAMSGLMILVPFGVGKIFDKVFGTSRTSFWLNFSRFLCLITSSLLIGLCTIKYVSSIFIQ